MGNCLAVPAGRRGPEPSSESPRHCGKAGRSTAGAVGLASAPWSAAAPELRARPVRELPGVGGKAAAVLAECRLHTVADVPRLTLQRLLGARAGITLHERAHGHDTIIVDPGRTSASISTAHHLDRDELDPAQHRRALLALADHLGT
ncbi:DNA polymerase thumb domain-containing protein [Streptomyces sp. NPDC101165]|uniref:DNA polymerase thumb domain-containing protein n=1 Tax=Streptomyces sp. NPDC101165 TaxID=3366119 RepID=UPI003811E108